MVIDARANFFFISLLIILFSGSKAGSELYTCLSEIHFFYLSA